MLKKIFNIIFILIIFVFLFSGFVKTVFFPHEINSYENRYAKRLEKITAESYHSGNFQDGMEAALSDQVFYAEDMKRSYNEANSVYIRTLLGSFTNTSTEKLRYIKVGDMNLIGDYIVYNPTLFENAEYFLGPQTEALDKLLGEFPEEDFYLFYIEKDTDINFETGIKAGIFEFLCDNLPIDAEKTGKFGIDSFEDFKKYFYRTDHHWNAEGAYRGYCELMELILPGEELILPGEKIIVGGAFSGSKAVGSELSAYSEEFSGYRYDYAQMEITVNGDPADDYGEQEAYFSGEKTDPTYGLFYGGDMGEIIFDTNNEEKENILILGESYDNAILKLVASHFNRTHSVDLRYYEAYMNKKFSLSEYLEEHDIDKVLLIGNIDYFIAQEFIPEN